jgi:hypothetical protein
MTQLERDTKRANKIWDCAAVLKELEAVANDWATEEISRAQHSYYSATSKGNRSEPSWYWKEGIGQDGAGF